MRRARGTLSNVAVWLPAALLVLIAGVLILLTAGCGQAPSSSAVDVVKSTDDYFDRPFTDPNDAQNGPQLGSLLYVTQASAWIDQYGGGLVRTEAGEFNFYAPGGAVNSNVFVTMKVTEMSFPGQSVVLLEFGPSGLVFNKPAMLFFDPKVLGEDVKSVSFYFLNPKTLLWELQTVVSTSQTSYDGVWDDQLLDEVIELPINHFSRYGVSD